MKEEEPHPYINELVASSFLNKDIYHKLYVCHYVFCSYILTKNRKLLAFGLDLLKESIKFSYLNKKKKTQNFYTSINYCISISVCLGIELEIEELIEDVHNKKQWMQPFMIYNEELLTSKNNVVKTLSNKKALTLVVLLQIRNELINKNNHLKYTQILHEWYSLHRNKEYLVCVAIIFHFFRNKKELNTVLDHLTQKKLSVTYKQIVCLIKTKYPDNELTTNRNISSVISSINNSSKIDLGIIYYSLLNGKTKHHIN